MTTRVLSINRYNIHGTICQCVEGKVESWSRAPQVMNGNSYSKKFIRLSKNLQQEEGVVKLQERLLQSFLRYPQT